ncbi:hypothetical protein RB8014 [Rhodopirellula baltica SH 1]|uniref:Uncharacterized protein n=1 Tax=Rhodopirellula baltica (strain DSM 10527 / NCIMB 13988 / SH1) TaxID=243090 RepID=Q7UGA9_RHOBA|nr:hypothetical protein RB8014 [Rhodopirellula baltica SH 1]
MPLTKERGSSFHGLITTPKDDIAEVTITSGGGSFSCPSLEWEFHVAFRDRVSECNPAMSN